MRPIFITGNARKAEQLSRYLHVPLDHQKIDLPEIQSLDLEEVVAHKAREAYRLLSSPVLVEDVALTFHALGRLPGPLVKWFLQELGNEGLCGLLDGRDDRSATAEVLFGLYDGHELRTFHGTRRGSVAETPAGAEEFGWNPVFIPEGETRTWAEMTPEEQRPTSMRRIALEKLAKHLAGE